MLEHALGNKVEYVNNLNADSASAYQKFCQNHSIKLKPNLITQSF